MERNKVDWLFNESGSISGSRNDAAQFKRNRWVGVVMKSNNWSQRHLVTRRTN